MTTMRINEDRKNTALFCRPGDFVAFCWVNLQ